MFVYCSREAACIQRMGRHTKYRTRYHHWTSIISSISFLSMLCLHKLDRSPLGSMFCYFRFTQSTLYKYPIMVIIVGFLVARALRAACHRMTFLSASQLDETSIPVGLLYALWSTKPSLAGGNAPATCLKMLDMHFAEASEFASAFCGAI